MKTTKPENFQKLLDELRSGNRQQGHDALRQVYGQVSGVPLVQDCCLGVACDLSGLGEWRKPSEFSTQRAYVIEGHGSEVDLLPEPVLEWLGIAPEDALKHPYLDSEGFERFNLKIPEAAIPDEYDEDDDRLVETAAEANDGGLTFSEIADLLEQEYMS